MEADQEPLDTTPEARKRYRLADVLARKCPSRGSSYGAGRVVVKVAATKWGRSGQHVKSE